MNINKIVIVARVRWLGLGAIATAVIVISSPMQAQQSERSALEDSVGATRTVAFETTEVTAADVTCIFPRMQSVDVKAKYFYHTFKQRNRT